VIGVNHGHINAQTNAILRARGELGWLYAKEPELVEAFRKQFPFVKVARSEAEVLEDPSIKLVVSAAIPTSAGRSGSASCSTQGLHVRQARHDDARAARGGAEGQAATKRIYSIMYSERWRTAPRSAPASS